MSAALVGESGLKVGRTAAGCCVRVEGRGTMRESRAAHAFIARCLPEPEARVVVDLSACTYLDSTFQGSLVGLQRQFGRGPDSRFTIANPSEACRRLLEQGHLDRFLTFTTEAPTFVGEAVPIAPEALDSSDVLRHVMECHRQLAHLGGPQQAIFRKIAEQMERELERVGAAGGAGGPKPIV